MRSFRLLLQSETIKNYVGLQCSFIHAATLVEFNRQARILTYIGMTTFAKINRMLSVLKCNHPSRSKERMRGEVKMVVIKP